MLGHHENSYVEFALAKSREHREVLLARPFSEATAARLSRMADESLRRQQTIEASESVTFEEYRRQYLSRDLTSGMRLGR